ncbi:MAG: histidinol-phosphate transaminase [Desulfamplus sp.]|nr:histidinol-phosphate transaminase [Desulfamplus sp.]MBF0389926.1 histidinol-phosphate transaminase [Desulfamplus sp.]
MKLNVLESIMSIKPYEPGKPIDELKREYGIKNIVKLASNENPVGPSPLAVKAIGEHLSTMNRYPDGSAFKLTDKLAEHFGVKHENIVIGNGSDDIIALLAHAFLGSGKEAIMPFPSFLMYEISVKTAGGTPVMVPLNGLEIDLDALADAVTDRTAMIFLTNPNNPTGSHFTTSQFNDFMKKIPSDVMVIVDEAYIEFARDFNIFNSLANPLFDQRVISLRTFSKAYGLAGFRVGYGIMDKEIAEVLHRIRQPFNVNSLAQVAAAAALDDDEFLQKGVKVMQEGVDYLSEELSKMGITTFPTQSNFFLLDVKRDATEVFKSLLKHGIITRSMKSYGFESYLRINAGLPEENRAFIEAFKQVISL